MANFFPRPAWRCRPAAHCMNAHTTLPHRNRLPAIQPASQRGLRLSEQLRVLIAICHLPSAFVPVLSSSQMVLFPSHTNHYGTTLWAGIVILHACLLHSVAPTRLFCTWHRLWPERSACCSESTRWTSFDPTLASKWLVLGTDAIYKLRQKEHGTRQDRHKNNTVSILVDNGGDTTLT